MYHHLNIYGANLCPFINLIRQQVKKKSTTNYKKSTSLFVPSYNFISFLFSEKKNKIIETKSNYRYFINR